VDLPVSHHYNLLDLLGQFGQRSTQATAVFAAERHVRQPNVPTLSIYRLTCFCCEHYQRELRALPAWFLASTVCLTFGCPMPAIAALSFRYLDEPTDTFARCDTGTAWFCDGGTWRTLYTMALPIGSFTSAPDSVTTASPTGETHLPAARYRYHTPALRLRCPTVGRRTVVRCGAWTRSRREKNFAVPIVAGHAVTPKHFSLHLQRWFCALLPTSTCAVCNAQHDSGSTPAQRL